MKKNLLKDTLGWGFLLWMIGYILGIAFFSIVPVSLVGWIILPIGTVITLWVLHRRVNGESIRDSLVIGVVWTGIAVLFDYLLIVRLFKPADGYYKLDVYLYYTLTFFLPIFVGWRKRQMPAR